MNAVQIVTIKSLRTLYKNGEAAERIELANVEEHGFDIVVQKGLYVVGDKAVYIQPDYCLPMPKEEGVQNTPAVKLFLDFTMPDGDVKKSKLGKNGRIRAIKFNFQLEGSSDPVYSVGIMMPIDIVHAYLPFDKDYADKNLGGFDNLFEVIKYEEPETAHSGMAKGGLPSGLYATDEPRFENLRVNFPLILTSTVKIDGSSITIYYRDDERQGICSRNLEKKLDQSQISFYTTPDGTHCRKHYDIDSNVRGWMVGDNRVENIVGVFHKEPDPSWTPYVDEIDDTFVKLGKPILAKLEEFCKQHGLEIALRGELCGTGLKGSGNKNNPHSKLPQQIIFYAADDYSSGVAKRVSLDTFYSICIHLGLVYAPVVFRSKQFNSWEELKDECDTYFKEHLIEGLVVKSDDATFSSKIMNAKYDSLK